MMLEPSFRTKAARGAASTALASTSLFALDGCAVVKGIFNAGVGVGVVLVVVVMAVGDGVAALINRG